MRTLRHRPGWVHETIARVQDARNGCKLYNAEGWFIFVPMRDLRGVVPRAGDRFSMYVHDTTRSTIGQTIQKLVIGEALIWDECPPRSGLSD